MMNYNPRRAIVALLIVYNVFLKINALCVNRDTIFSLIFYVIAFVQLEHLSERIKLFQHATNALIIVMYAHLQKYAYNVHHNFTFNTVHNVLRIVLLDSFKIRIQIH